MSSLDVLLDMERQGRVYSRMQVADVVMDYLRGAEIPLELLAEVEATDDVVCVDLRWQTPRQALTRLAKATRCRWWVDETGRLRFAPGGAEKARADAPLDYTLWVKRRITPVVAGLVGPGSRSQAREARACHVAVAQLAAAYDLPEDTTRARFLHLSAELDRPWREVCTRLLAGEPALVAGLTQGSGRRSHA